MSLIKEAETIPEGSGNLIVYESHLITVDKLIPFLQSNKLPDLCVQHIETIIQIPKPEYMTVQKHPIINTLTRKIIENSHKRKRDLTSLITHPVTIKSTRICHHMITVRKFTLKQLVCIFCSCK